MPRKLSVNLDLEGRRVLLLGCGKVGQRKLSYLLDSGASITVAEPRPDESLVLLAKEGKITLLPEFDPGLLDDPPPLVFVAMRKEDSREILEAVKKKGLWHNVAGDGEEGNFFLPALAEDGPFRLTVTTDGASPALSALLAEKFRKECAGLGKLVLFLKDIRPHVLASVPEQPERRKIFQRLAASPELLAFIKAGDREGLERLARELAAPATLPPDFGFRV